MFETLSPWTNLFVNSTVLRFYVIAVENEGGTGTPKDDADSSSAFNSIKPGVASTS
jgi:hypothetical protein